MEFKEASLQVKEINRLQEHQEEGNTKVVDDHRISKRRLDMSVMYHEDFIRDS